MEELPQGDETFGVPTEGYRVPGEDVQGRRGCRNPPTTQSTEASRTRVASGGNEGMTRRTSTALLPIPQLDIAADKDRVGTLHRHSNGADGARPKNSMQLRREYVLLAPEEPLGDPADAGTQVRGAGHRDTRGTDDQG